MLCHNHPLVKTGERCAACKKPYCASCLADVQGKRYCSMCKLTVLHKQGAFTAGAAPAQPQASAPAQPPPFSLPPAGANPAYTSGANPAYNAGANPAYTSGANPAFTQTPPMPGGFSGYTQNTAAPGGAPGYAPASGMSPGTTLGYAPPGAPGYQQAAAVAEQPAAAIDCPEAKQALICGIIGFFCLGLALGWYAISKGSQAKKMIALNPQMRGSGKATAGMVLGIIDVIGWGLGLLYRILGS